MVAKLALVGEQAGFTADQLIELLETGTSIQDLLRLIERGLTAPRIPITSRRIV